MSWYKQALTSLIIDDSVNSQKKIDTKKIDKAFNDFLSFFDSEDLTKSNKKLEELIKVANFRPAEKHKFRAKVLKELSKKNVFLDCIK